MGAAVTTKTVKYLFWLNSVVSLQKPCNKSSKSLCELTNQPTKSVHVNGICKQSHSGERSGGNNFIDLYFMLSSFIFPSTFFIGIELKRAFCTCHRQCQGRSMVNAMVLTIDHSKSIDKKFRSEKCEKHFCSTNTHTVFGQVQNDWFAIEWTLCFYLFTANTCVCFCTSACYERVLLNLM